MTLIELRYVVSLANTQHFGRAAQACGVNQSTLSMAVRKLEDELGVLLFERNKSGICVTEMGGKIVTQARRVFSQIESITALAAADKNQLGGSLKIGAIFTLGPYILPQLIPQLSMLAHNLKLELHEGYQTDLRSKLRSGELDVILISQPFTELDIVTQEIYTESLQLIMPINHPFAAKKIISTDDLHTQTFLLLNKKQCLRAQMLQAYNPSDDRIIECSSLETLRHMVAIGLGVSILPTSTISSSLYSQQALVARPLMNSPKREIFLAWRASFPRHKAIDLIRRAIQICTWQFTTAHDAEDSGLLVNNTRW